MAMINDYEEEQGDELEQAMEAAFATDLRTKRKPLRANSKFSLSKVGRVVVVRARRSIAVLNSARESSRLLNGCSNLPVEVRY